MRFKIGLPWRAAGRALMVFAPVILSSVAPSSAQQRAPGFKAEYGQNTQSIVRISEADGVPVRKSIKIGLGKSVLIEFPNGVRDVMASNPAVVDAVVLSSNRVFLLGKAPGQSNAFFFSNKGEQLALIELNVDQEGDGLETLLRRVIPGSDIKVETLNQTVILTGHVKSPSEPRARFENIRAVHEPDDRELGVERQPHRGRRRAAIAT